jgi:hypothetical protein
MKSIPVMLVRLVHRSQAENMMKVTAVAVATVNGHPSRVAHRCAILED